MGKQAVGFFLLLFFAWNEASVFKLGFYLSACLKKIDEEEEEENKPDSKDAWIENFQNAQTSHKILSTHGYLE